MSLHSSHTSTHNHTQCTVVMSSVQLLSCKSSPLWGETQICHAGRQFTSSGRDLATTTLSSTASQNVQHKHLKYSRYLDPTLEDIRPSLNGCLHRRGTGQLIKLSSAGIRCRYETAIFQQCRFLQDPSIIRNQPKFYCPTWWGQYNNIYLVQ